MIQRIRLALLALALPAVLACGGKDPEEEAPGIVDETLPLLPFAGGNTWTYDVTDSTGVRTRKVTTVGAEGPVGGTGPHAAQTAFAVVTVKADGADETRSWQGRDGDRIVRYREQGLAGVGGVVQIEEHWDPPKLRVDGSAARTAEGASWPEQTSETKIAAGTPDVTVQVTDLWEVVKAAESVTVPAGTFTATVLQKTAGSASVKRYWFVRGVGKVKETGTQTEELVEFDVE